MKCEGCGAEIMLGSAQCERCGRPIVGADQGPASGAGRVWNRWTAPPPPGVLGTPPAPGAGQSPPPPGHPAPPRRPAPAGGAGRARQIQQPAVKRSGSGRGCLLTVVVAGVLLSGAGSAVFRAIGDAIDDARDTTDAADARDDDGIVDPGNSTRFRDRDRVPGPALVLGEPLAASIDDDESGVHELLVGEGRFTIAVDGGSDGFDPVVRVIDPTGTVVGENDDGDGLDSRLTFSTPGREPFTAEVTEFGGDGGDYQILVVAGDQEPAE